VLATALGVTVAAVGIIGTIYDIYEIGSEVSDIIESPPGEVDPEDTLTSALSDKIIGSDDTELVDAASLEVGTADADFLISMANLVVHGAAGDDVILSYNDAIVSGDAGDDLIFAFNSANQVSARSEITGGDGNDTILYWAAQPVTEASLFIDAGAGDDWVVGLGSPAEIFLGKGNDTFVQAGDGSIVHGGEGKDTFWYTDGIIVTDATGDDTLSYYGFDLDLALAWGGAESQWATFTDMGLVWASFNTDGELVVQDFISYIHSRWDAPANAPFYKMYFANGNRDPNAPEEDRTAGVRVAGIEFDAASLMDLKLGALKGLFDLLELLAANLRDTLKENKLATDGDPLVLDLDGDGLELMARSSVAPLFDVDGDMFAERTGWVMRDDGLLAVDANGNGKIDDVSELFGSQFASGFVELATYDSTGDGKVDAADAKFADLRIWQDKDGDGLTDAGELLTLAEAKIASIATASTPLSNTKNALNTMAAQGTFTRADGSAGGIYDVRFLTNDFKSRYIGDTAVIAAVAATRPNLKGRGTLMDLQVAARRHAVRQPERRAA
jgi:hypothetical protein